MTRTVKVSALSLGDIIIEGQGERAKNIRVNKITRCPGSIAPRYAPLFYHVNDYHCYWGEGSVEVYVKENSK